MNAFSASAMEYVFQGQVQLLLPAIAEMAGLSFSKYGVSVVSVGGVGLYHYARILQRQKAGESIPLPVACITDRDIVPDMATYVPKPKKGKRFEADFGPGEAPAAVKRKVDRVESIESPNVKVFVADNWTLEYDLARSGLAEMMYCAIQLAAKAGAKGERLTEADEAVALIEAKASWPAVKGGAGSDEALAVTVYQPLFEEDASKAIAAEYAGRLLRTGDYGTGEALLNKLPSYLKRSLRHLTKTSDPLPVGAVAAP